MRHAVAADGSSSTDEDALAKAMRRKASMLGDGAGTVNSSKSFLAFSNSSISAKLSNVGVSLGNNDKKLLFRQIGRAHV